MAWIWCVVLQDAEGRISCCSINAQQHHAVAATAIYLFCAALVHSLGAVLQGHRVLFVAIRHGLQQFWAWAVHQHLQFDAWSFLLFPTVWSILGMSPALCTHRRLEQPDSSTCSLVAAQHFPLEYNLFWWTCSIGHDVVSHTCSTCTTVGYYLGMTVGYT